MKGFTNIKDVDIEILLNLGDFDFIKMSTINKYFYYNVYTNNFFKRRLSKFYPDTLKFKNIPILGILRFKNNGSWKKYFLDVIWCISRMKKVHDFNYSTGDATLQYEIFTQTFGSYTRLLYMAAERGELSLVRESIFIGGINILNQHYEYALIKASSNGYLDIVKYLISIGTYVPQLAKDNSTQFLDVFEYLKEAEKKQYYLLA